MQIPLKSSNNTVQSVVTSGIVFIWSSVFSKLLPCGYTRAATATPIYMDVSAYDIYALDIYAEKLGGEWGGGKGVADIKITCRSACQIVLESIQMEANFV